MVQPFGLWIKTMWPLSFGILGVWLIVISLVVWFHRTITAMIVLKRGQMTLWLLLTLIPASRAASDEGRTSASVSIGAGGLLEEYLSSGSVMGCCCCCISAVIVSRTTRVPTTTVVTASAMIVRCFQGLHVWIMASKAGKTKVPYFVLYHVLMAPVDIVVDLPILLSRRNCACWRYPSMSRKAAWFHPTRLGAEAYPALTSCTQLSLSVVANLPAIPALIIWFDLR